MRYGSVCSGIEAATHAWHPLGWTPAFFSEIEKFPSAVLAHHYGSNMPGEAPTSNGVPNLGDMRKFEEWPDYAIDLLVGGTPCQSFSVAGLRKGLDDPRGNLMLTFGAIAQRYRPSWVVWENVPGVLSDDGGLGFASLLGLLSGRRVEVPHDGWRNAGVVPGYQGAYGLAWRVLDAQFIRVDGFGRAVPQRRRRVFVVGYLGDWRRAAAVLLEREGMRGDSPPRREAGKDVAPTISSRPTGGGGLGTDFDLDGGLIEAFVGNNTRGPIEVSTAVNAHGGPAGRMDFERETFVAHGVAPPVTHNPYGDHESREGLLVAHSLRAEGFDAGEDGTGRGTPIVPVYVADTLVSNGDAHSGFRDEKGLVPVPMTLAIRGRNGEPDLEWRQDGTANAVLTPNGGRAGIGVGEIAFEAAAFNWQAGGDETTSFKLHECSPTLTKNQTPAALTQWAVRRLTPTECHRLQGFRDGFCNIPWRGKPDAPDGPQYKALGNSMAVNVMRWIGHRIKMIEEIVTELAA